MLAAEVSLDHLALTVVAEGADGEKRQLELAVALARSPKILLLDEPMAGMGSEEKLSR
ncbi:ATP-binding cassette domain-containing protein [Oligella ureolytica]